MFGYVTPDKGEMKVREYECYRAVYCGLCMQLKADYGFVSRMLLNYDLVTVALLADGISGEKGSPCMKRCMANPLRRRCMHAGPQGLRLAAASLVLLSWYKLQLAKAGVPVRYGREANHDNVAAWKPDRIIWAAGGAPIMPKSIPGLDGYSVYSATDALRNLVDVGERIVMVGGGMVGCEAAEFLTEREHIVDMVEMKPVIGEDIVPEARKYIMANLEKHKVTQRVNARVKQFYADGVDYTDLATLLLHGGNGGPADRYMSLKDFSSYAIAQERVSEMYRHAENWNYMSLMNIANSGRFAADRSIAEYAQNIWRVKTNFAF